MAIVRLPHRLAALARVAAADVQAVYAAIAGVLNGQLTWRNFAPRADIPESLKVEPYSMAVYGGSIRWPAAGQSRTFTFVHPAALAKDAKVYGVTAAFCGCASVGGNAQVVLVTGTLEVLLNGGALFPLQNFAGRAGGRIYSGVVGADTSIHPGDKIEVRVTVTSYDLGAYAAYEPNPQNTVGDIQCHVWLKHRHVR